MMNPISDPIMDAVTEKHTTEPMPDTTFTTDVDGDEPAMTGTTDILLPTPFPVTQITVVPDELMPTDKPLPDPSPVGQPKVSFKDDIQPILLKRCAIPGCHAAGGASGLDLSNYDTIKRGGEGGAAFVTGNGKSSLIVRRIDGGGMPPMPPPLNADQIQLFINWINEGAENN